MRIWVLKVVFLAILAGAIYLAMSTGFSREDPDPECEVPVIVEVLNGCGVSGVADKVAARLRREDFDVMFVGNADDFNYEETLIVDRSGACSKAITVARALGVKNVVQQVRESFFVDVSVVVGSDMAESLASAQ
ncbi:MAG: LytR C-terminal domain-containing protein [bacterium]